MQASEILNILDAKALVIANDEAIEDGYLYGFATDLMSDALAMIQTAPEKTILITGLANHQTINTAEMLDINLILLVRGKWMEEEILHMAIDKGLNLFKTELSMYEAGGILYQNGLEPIQ